MPADSIDLSSLVEYRTLSRKDFRATEPPEKSEAHADHLGALLCASIGGDGDLLIDFETPVDAKVQWFVFRDANYRARMDPECSWWNAEQDQVPAEYVLEHEQIHFALLEQAAREINREIAQLRVRVGSRDRAPSLAGEHLDSILEAARNRVLDRSRRFDEQTSRRPNAKAQARWRSDVEAALDRTE